MNIKQNHNIADSLFKYISIFMIFVDTICSTSDKIYQ